MNVPLVPPIDLAPMADLVVTKLPRKVAKGLASFARYAGAGTGTAALGLRLAPPLVAILRRVRPKRRSPAPWIAAGAGLVGLGLAGWQLKRLFTPEPKHSVEPRQNDLEIRRYAPVRIAETNVDASWEDALDEGFHRLASFIFGGNAQKQHIAMTAPVTAMRHAEGYALGFWMPEGVDLPHPDDARILIRPLPSRRVAVLRFNGRYDDEAVEDKKRELVELVEKSGLIPRGDAIFAGYDPPWTVPLLRRNEVWVEIEH